MNCWVWIVSAFGGGIIVGVIGAFIGLVFKWASDVDKPSC